MFERPSGENQRGRFPIARAVIGIGAAILMRRAAYDRFDAIAPCGREENVAKHPAPMAHRESGACLRRDGFGPAHGDEVERRPCEIGFDPVAPASTNLIPSHVAGPVPGVAGSYR